MTNTLRLCLAAAWAMAAPGAAQAVPLPAMVEAAIKEQKAICAPERATLAKGFVARRDINGDGTEDFILDYGKFRCGTLGSFFCGSAGCTTQVFASLPNGGYARVLDANVQDVQFRTVGGRPVMILGLHGSACGKVGAAPCDATLFWDGRTFKRGR